MAKIKRFIGACTEHKCNKLDKLDNIDWNEWVAASKTRNYALQNTLIDWLDLHGHKTNRNYTSNIKPLYKRQESINRQQESIVYKTYKTPTPMSFTDFIMKKGIEFEEYVISMLKSRYTKHLVTVGETPADARSYNKFNQTVEYMKQGVPIIYQAVLWNYSNKTYGIPDLLVRSDWLNKIVPYSIPNDMETIPAQYFNSNTCNVCNTSQKSSNNRYKYHYVIVDIKLSTIHLCKDNKTIRTVGSIPAYKTQLCVYNIALGEIQGYRPRMSFILGRCVEYFNTVNGVGSVNGVNSVSGIHGESCFQKLGAVDYAQKDSDYVRIMHEAIKWRKDVQLNGHEWELSVPPTRPELYPNMNRRDSDGIWKTLIDTYAKKLAEITMVWNCGIKNRLYAHSRDIYRWDDTKCNTDTLNVTGEKHKKIITAILDVNRPNGNTGETQSSQYNPRKRDRSEITKTDENYENNDNTADRDDVKKRCREPLIIPSKLTYNLDNWMEKEALELYVDFETVSGINDEYIARDNKNGCSEYNEISGVSMVFMIGIGWEDPDTGKWCYKNYTAKRLTLDEEKRIFNNFNTLVCQLQKLYEIPSYKKPKMVHWSNAENREFDRVLSTHKNRWNLYNWFDLYKVFKEEPIAIKGALSYKLKEIAGAMYDNKMISSKWDSETGVDGLNAMLIAWKCNSDIIHETNKNDISMKHDKQMLDVIKYNEIDCKVLWEIITYLRHNCC